MLKRVSFILAVVLAAFSLADAHPLISEWLGGEACTGGEVILRVKSSRTSGQLFLWQIVGKGGP